MVLLTCVINPHWQLPNLLVNIPHLRPCVAQITGAPFLLGATPPTPAALPLGVTLNEGAPQVRPPDLFVPLYTLPTGGFI